MLLDADFERRLEEQIEKRKVEPILTVYVRVVDHSHHQQELEKKIDDEKMVRMQMIASLKNMEVELGEVPFVPIYLNLLTNNTLLRNYLG